MKNKILKIPYIADTGNNIFQIKTDSFIFEFNLADIINVEKNQIFDTVKMKQGVLTYQKNLKKFSFFLNPF